MKDTSFFDKESVQYSKKRYTKRADNYLQAFFNHRLHITKRYLTQITSGKSDATLLEVGCADGIILREIAKDFPHLKKLVGIDIATHMIEEATRQNTDPRVSFMVREAYRSEPVDIVVETGVINYSHVEKEIRYAYDNLKEEGYFILSIAGTDSIYNRIKRDTLSDFRTYKEYPPLITAYFEVCEVKGAGFFVPLIWKIPMVARPLQALAEAVGEYSPSLCHEKMYLLRKKTI
jgi:SAM-dependent methyltransferase